jgi:hypothetical protein
VNGFFTPPTNAAPAFAGVRARPGQKYAVEWVKKRLRKLYREARAAGHESPLNEAAAHLYLLIATYVLDRRYISEEIPLQELVGIMHCKSITVTRARKRLMALDEVRLIDGGQGKAHVRFALAKMGGPLFAEHGGAAAVSAEATSIPEIEVTSIPEIEVLRSQSQRLLTTSILEIEAAASTYKVLVEEDPSSSESTEQNDVDRLVEWWIGNFPLHNGGALNTLRQCDWDAAVFLLDQPGYTVQRVKALARILWAVTSDGHQNSDRWYIAQRSDRSLRTLQQKQNFLEHELARTRLAEDDDVWQDVLRRIEVRVNRHDFYYWWKDSTLVEDRGDILVVRMYADREQHKLRADWVQRHFVDVLEESVAAVRAGACVEFSYDLVVTEGTAQARGGRR